ncbi:hypothetical protein VTO42DRAFT_5054 [Malbranchea cinnamomea]
MASIFASIRRIVTGSKVSRAYGRSIDTNFSIFQEGDRVVIHGKNPILSKPLQRGKKITTPRGHIDHDDIIGRSTRDFVRPHKGPHYRISYPTLEEYVTLTPRLVTPVYAADANLIVSLLDIHTPVASPEGHQDETLEILEAGTGHGSLTLHIARAINAANSSPPPIPKASQRQILDGRTAENRRNHDDPIQREWDEWRARRGAVIHTVDINEKYSAHAEMIVRGFRRGLYAGNVDFYVSSVENWIQEQIRRRSKGLFIKKSVKPFLSYAILDMPSAHLRIPHVASVLKPDGILAVFMPNITQIGECVNLIREKNLPFVMDRAVELGTGISSGRLWDIRIAQTRSRGKLTTGVNEEAADGAAEETPEETSDMSAAEKASDSAGDKSNTESVLVCRPKVGERIVGGGFVGIWRRMKH